MRLKHKIYGFECEMVCPSGNGFIFDTPYGRGWDLSINFEVIDDDIKK